MSILERFKIVTTFVLDVDGVLTDGSILILEDGQMARKMNIKDGYALQAAVKKNYNVVIISGGKSEPVKDRLQKLGIQDVFLNTQDKLTTLANYINDKGISWEEILFMGDDLPDYQCMKKAGLACCPSDAAMEIVGISKYISPFKGGEGCVRDIIEKTMKLGGTWEVFEESPGM
jgi:3-deoxy-D-manno-octulosonate 8-phosphate phosphatase (KDO 8-P phosphatase)